MFVSHFFVGQSFVVVVLDRFFFNLGDKKWSLVALGSWSFYAVMIAWEFACADTALVISDEVPCYRGGRLKRFDYIVKKVSQHLPSEERLSKNVM